MALTDINALCANTDRAIEGYAPIWGRTMNHSYENQPYIEAFLLAIVALLALSRIGASLGVYRTESSCGLSVYADRS
jgi:hypothetical protein